MKPYQKTYFKYFGYDEHDPIYCEVCGAIANDIHHIIARGMGGSKHRDNIENLMAFIVFMSSKWLFTRLVQKLTIATPSVMQSPSQVRLTFWGLNCPHNLELQITNSIFA